MGIQMGLPMGLFSRPVKVCGLWLSAASHTNFVNFHISPNLGLLSCVRPAIVRPYSIGEKFINLGPLTYTVHPDIGNKLGYC